MPDQDFDWGNVALEGQAELLLGWRPGPGHVTAAAVELSPSVASDLANAAKQALRHLETMDHRPFSEALALEIGEQYAVVATADLPTRRDASVASDSVDRASKSVARW